MNRIKTKLRTILILSTMMDELELLKKDWKRRDSEHPKLSYDDLYGMIWKRSSSL